MKHWHRLYREDVLVTIHDFRGTPRSMVDRAVAAKKAEARSAKRGRGRAYDEIWCVFDRDEHPEVSEAIRLAADNGIKIAVSNPCIELCGSFCISSIRQHISTEIAPRNDQAII